jgi:hypothetical protein
LVEELYSYFLPEFYEEARELYVKFILLEAGLANDRKKYKKVCKMIERYKKTFGNESAQNIIRSLSQNYVKKPAFIDELGKL